MKEQPTADECASIKSAHALILNRLHEMQRAPYYATARYELALAESTIVQLERRVAELEKKLEQAQWASRTQVASIPPPGCTFGPLSASHEPNVVPIGLEPADPSELTVGAIRQRAVTFNHFFSKNGGYKGYEAQAIDALLERLEALRDALDAIASPGSPTDYGWWTQVARRALGFATTNETAQPPQAAEGCGQCDTKEPCIRLYGICDRALPPPDTALRFKVGDIAVWNGKPRRIVGIVERYRVEKEGGGWIAIDGDNLEQNPPTKRDAP